MSRVIQAKDGNGHTISLSLSDGDMAVLKLFRHMNSGETKVSISAISVDGDNIFITIPDRFNKSHSRIYDLKKSQIL